jgi:microcystin-dependent protein
MSLTPFDPTQPLDNATIASWPATFRAFVQQIIDFLTVSFNLTDGTLKSTAIPNPVTTPYGAAGTVYTSAGVSTPPTWATPATLIPGMIVDYGASAAPTGWLICDGSTPLIATYPALAALFGTTYGGNGTTTFGLPDFRGRVSVGLGTGSASGATAWTLGRSTGAETHVIATSELPTLSHGGNTVPSGTGAPVSTTYGATGTAMSLLQPSLGMNKIVKT